MNIMRSLKTKETYETLFDQAKILVESRVRLYSKMKTKTLLTLPLDPKSMV